MYWKIKREHTEEMIKVGELNKSLQRMEISKEEVIRGLGQIFIID